MANTIKVKRGTDANRASVTPAEGELLYTTDTKKVYVGDGSTAGGNEVGGGGGSSQTPAELLADIKTVDGTGSGLDADLLDGQHGSYYAAASSLNSYLPISGGTLTGTLNYRMLGSQPTSNLDTCGDSSGFSTFYGNTGATSKPSGTDHSVLTLSYSDKWQTQLAGDWRTKQLYYRTQENGTWKTWATIWHSDNDGSGSGLDADLLDGQQGSYYAAASSLGNYLPRTGGTLDGGTNTTLNIKANDDGLALLRLNGDSQGTGAVEVGQSTNYGGGISYNGDGSPGFVNGETSDAITFYRLAAGVRTEVFYYPYSSNRVTFNQTPYVGGSAIWSAGNDGSGSGLDADTVDGLQGSSFLRSNANDVATGEINLRSNLDMCSDSSTTSRYVHLPRGGGITFYGDDSTNHSITSRNSAGTVTDDLTISSYGAVYIKLDANNNNSSGADFVITSNNSTTQRLNFSGENYNLTVSGNVTAYSDLRLKENIEAIPDALSKVAKLRGVTFTRNDLDDKETRHSGVIAQEVEDVMPEVVSEDKDGIKNVAYGNMVGLLIEAIKELKSEVDDLKQQLEQK